MWNNWAGSALSAKSYTSLWLLKLFGLLLVYLSLFLSLSLYPCSYRISCCDFNVAYDILYAYPDRRVNLSCVQCQFHALNLIISQVDHSSNALILIIIFQKYVYADNLIRGQRIFPLHRWLIFSEKKDLTFEGLKYFILKIMQWKLQNIS